MFELVTSEVGFVDGLKSLCEKYGSTCEFSNPRVMEKIGLAHSQFAKIKSSLVAKGILEDRRGCKFTPQAISQCDVKKAEVLKPIITEVIKRVPMAFPLAGQVKAGWTKQDDLRVYMTDLEAINKDTAEMRTIPAIESDSGAFLLEVVGESMVHLGIYEGTFLLVKPFPRGGAPHQGQLIVTRYLLAANVEEANERKGNYDDLFDGPTVKYYHEVPRGVYKHRLTSHKKVSDSTFEVYAAEIKADGFVVGMYRDID